MVEPDVLVVMVTVGEFTFGPAAGLKAGVATVWATSALAAKDSRHASMKRRKSRRNGMGGKGERVGAGTKTTRKTEENAEFL